MSHTITTAAELDALPVGSVILDNMGDAGFIDDRDGERHVQYAETSRVSLRYAAKHYLPATVLHNPSAPAPAPSAVPEVAPSATREEVADVLDQAADALLARFTITPKGAGR